MEAKVNRAQLLGLLGKIGSAMPRKAYLPVLKMFRVEAAQGKLIVSTTDLECQLSGTMKARVAKAGSLLLPQEAVAFIKASSAEMVTITLVDHAHKREVVKEGVVGEDDGNRKPVKKVSHSYSVMVTAGKATSTFDTMDVADYPPVVTVKGKPIKVTGLAHAIGEVGYAMAKEDNRPVLAGVCFTPKRGSIELAAADGFRLAIVSLDCQGKLPAQVVLSRTVIGLLEKHYKGDLIIRAEAQPHKADDPFIDWKLSFEADGLVLATKTIAGKFPDYHQLIPTRGSILTTKTTDLIEAVKMALSAIPPKQSEIVRLHMTSKGLKVMSKWDGGKVESVIKAEGRIKIAFNGRYLAEVLARSPEKKFTMRTTNGPGPGLLGNNGTTHVLMPMFVEWDQPKPKAFNGVTTMRPVVGTPADTEVIP